jgi:hypothetical protein
MIKQARTVLSLSADPLHARRMVRRAALFWAAVRGSLLFLSAAGVAVALSPAGVLLVTGIVAVLCHVDARFMREGVFYANLGTPVWAPAVTGVILSLAAELLLVAGSAVGSVLR